MSSIPREPPPGPQLKVGGWLWPGKGKIRNDAEFFKIVSWAKSMSIQPSRGLLGSGGSQNDCIYVK